MRTLFAPGAPLATWAFLRALGVVYLCAFLSLFPQILGLIGARGVLPAAPYLGAVSREYGAAAYALLPTVFWVSASDTALHLACIAGIVAALLVVVGRLQAPALLLLWILYLSFVGVGREFLSFQWDTLLLETGFLAVFLVPLRPREPAGFFRAQPSPAVVRWLMLWLLFRLMWSAGWVKLRSGDPTWRDLTALHYHFETQPLPTLLGYYAHRLPGFIKSASVLATFLIELAVPFLIVVPRLRRVAFFPLVALQIAIAATGNYGYFNLLTAALCLWLLPEPWIARILNRALRQRTPEITAAAPRSGLRLIPPAIFLSAVLFLSVGQALSLFLRHAGLPSLMRAAMEAAEGYHLTSRYGLFAVMTTTRPEIVIEGSMDGKEWHAYEFPYKAGDLSRHPRWNAPHQPRLDWQLWFAALGEREDNPWFSGLCIRLLQGSPDVLYLLEKNPFPGKPPRQLRAIRYQYHFTDRTQKSATGQYWTRTDPEVYLQPVSMD